MNHALLSKLESQIAATRARHDASPNARVRAKYRARLIKLNRHRRHVKTCGSGRWRHIWRTFSHHDRVHGFTFSAGRLTGF